jgi:hypothetical protein
MNVMGPLWFPKTMLPKPLVAPPGVGDLGHRPRDDFGLEHHSPIIEVAQRVPAEVVSTLLITVRARLTSARLNGVTGERYSKLATADRLAPDPNGRA